MNSGNIQSLEQAIQFAIERETEAEQMYQKLIGLAKDPKAKELFEDLRDMEAQHRQNLQTLDVAGFKEKHNQERVYNMQIADYLIDKKIDDVRTFQEGLMLAARREQMAYQYYSLLAETYRDNPGLFEFFSVMAREERSHQNDMEKEYDENVLLYN